MLGNVKCNLHVIEKEVQTQTQTSRGIEVYRNTNVIVSHVHCACKLEDVVLSLRAQISSTTSVEAIAMWFLLILLRFRVRYKLRVLDEKRYS